jgi:O-antigen biosynthesis protein WbqP
MDMKRVFDLLLAVAAVAAAVVLAVPVMLVAVLVRLTSPGPAL